MRRAQVQHIFIFIIGLIVVSLIVLFGYTTLQDMNERRCEVQKNQFTSNLLQAIERNKAWGTSQAVNLQAPCETERVCFVDRRIIDNPTSTSANNWFSELPEGGTTRTVIQASIDTNRGAEGLGDQTNVFTITPQGIVEPLERLSTAAAAIEITTSGAWRARCFTVQQETLRIRMSGTGRAVSITNQ